MIFRLNIIEVKLRPRIIGFVVFSINSVPLDLIIVKKVKRLIFYKCFLQLLKLEAVYYAECVVSCRMHFYIASVKDS